MTKTAQLQRNILLALAVAALLISVASVASAARIDGGQVYRYYYRGPSACTCNGESRYVHHHGGAPIFRPDAYNWNVLIGRHSEIHDHRHRECHWSSGCGR